MLSLQARFRPNEKEVAAKVLDGEAIIINLSNGIYYSTDKVGGVLWAMLAEGYSLEEILAAIVARYDVSPEQARADIERLAAELLQENVVLASDHAPPPREHPEPRQKLAYESPQLNIHRDMGDLLALDPPMPGLEEIPWKEPAEGSSG
jgi:hypothetical protein